MFEFEGSKLKVQQRLLVMSGLQEVSMLYADDLISSLSKVHAVSDCTEFFQLVPQMC